MPPIWISEKSDAGSVTQWISPPPQDLWSISSFYILFCLFHVVPTYHSLPWISEKTDAGSVTQWMTIYVVSLTLLIFAILSTYYLHVRLWCCTGFFGLLGPSCCALFLFFSFKHATDGRFTAACPPPPFPSSLGFRFPSLCLPALSHTVSPLLPLKKHSFFVTLSI